MEDLVERNLGSSPSEAARTASSYARDYARDGRDYAYDVADQLRSATRSQPLVAIGSLPLLDLEKARTFYWVVLGLTLAGIALLVVIVRSPLPFSVIGSL